MDLPVLSSFVDELEKISVAAGGAHVSKTRTGTRPISAEKLIAKHNDGSLLRKTADSAGSPQNVRGDSVDDPGAAQPPRRQGEVPTKERGNIPESVKTGATDPMRAMFHAFDRYKSAMVPGANTQTPAFTSGEDPFAYQEAKKPRKKGDVPSKDDGNVIDRFDLREAATTVHGLGQHSTNIGATNNSGESY